MAIFTKSEPILDYHSLGPPEAAIERESRVQDVC